MGKQAAIKQWKKIRNIGPKMAEKLYHAEIETHADLVRIGAEEAYLQIDEPGGFCRIHHPAYLYALEGAIINCPWQNLPKERKEELKQFAATLSDH